MPAYFALACIFLLFAWCAGGYAHALLAGRSQAAGSFPGNSLFIAMLRFASGFAVLSWVAALFGVLGAFKVIPVAITGLAVLIAGWTIGAKLARPMRPAVTQDWASLRERFSAAAKGEKLLSVAAVLFLLVICLNAFIGALVPDMNQDPMWYHLSVPQQWVFTHRFDVLPSVMPSAYPLATEALFSMAFIFGGNAIACSLLVALGGMVLFLAMAAGSYASLASGPHKKYAGWGMMAVLGFWIPQLCIYGYYGPLQPKNDYFAMLWMFAGMMSIYLPILQGANKPKTSELIVGGFLLGTACSAKPSMMVVSFIALVFAGVICARRQVAAGEGFAGTLLKNGALSVACLLVAMAPWMYRAWHSHGLPFYPLGRSIFPINPDYVQLLDAFDRLNGFTNAKASSWFSMVTGFPQRLAMGAAGGEKVIFVFLVTVLLGLFAKDKTQRWFAAMLCCQLVMLVGMKGAMEVFRFFSPVYCIAAPLIAYLAAQAAGFLRSPVRLFLAISVFFIGTLNMINQQIRLASFKTYAWKYRPILAEQDIWNYSHNAELGSVYRASAAVRKYIKPDEKVLFIGGWFPFYLHRNALWNDEVVGAGGLDDIWNNMDDATAKKFLVQQNIDFLLFAGNEIKQSASKEIATRLQQNGMLTPVDLSDDPDAIGWQLYRVTAAD